MSIGLKSSDHLVDQPHRLHLFSASPSQQPLNRQFKQLQALVEIETGRPEETKVAMAAVIHVEAGDLI